MVARLAIFKDQWPGAWSEFTQGPVKAIVQAFPCLRTCAVPNCGCASWHGVDNSGEPEAILELFGRQIVDDSYRQVPASQATIFNIFVRIPNGLESRLQSAAGQQGMYAEPMVPVITFRSKIRGGTTSMRVEQPRLLPIAKHPLQTRYRPEVRGLQDRASHRRTSVLLRSDSRNQFRFKFLAMLQRSTRRLVTNYPRRKLSLTRAWSKCIMWLAALRSPRRCLAKAKVDRCRARLRHVSNRWKLR